MKDLLIGMTTSNINNVCCILYVCMYIYIYTSLNNFTIHDCKNK